MGDQLTRSNMTGARLLDERLGFLHLSLAATIQWPLWSDLWDLWCGINDESVNVESAYLPLPLLDCEMCTSVYIIQWIVIHNYYVRGRLDI